MTSKSALLNSFFIKNGANINATNDVGDSALNIAISSSEDEFENQKLHKDQFDENSRQK